MLIELQQQRIQISLLIH